MDARADIATVWTPTPPPRAADVRGHAPPAGSVPLSALDMGLYDDWVLAPLVVRGLVERELWRRPVPRSTVFRVPPSQTPSDIALNAHRVSASADRDTGALSVQCDVELRVTHGAYTGGGALHELFVGRVTSSGAVEPFVM